MSLRIFKPAGISPKSENAVDAWISDLADLDLVCIRADSNHGKWGDAPQALLQGEPFILAGDPSTIHEYLRTLDSQLAGILRRSQAFWILTSSDEYKHARLPASRQVVLGWNGNDQELIRSANTANSSSLFRGSGSARFRSDRTLDEPDSRIESRDYPCAADRGDSMEHGAALRLAR